MNWLELAAGLAPGVDLLEVVGRKHLSLREQASAAERQRGREELQALTER